MSNIAADSSIIASFPNKMFVDGPMHSLHGRDDLDQGMQFVFGFYCFGVLGNLAAQLNKFLNRRFDLLIPRRHPASVESL